MKHAFDLCAFSETPATQIPSEAKIPVGDFGGEGDGAAAADQVHAGAAESGDGAHRPVQDQVAAKSEVMLLFDCG